MKLNLNRNKEQVWACLQNIETSLKELPDLDLFDLEPQHSAIVFVDVIEGFVNVGNLSSERALDILPFVEKLNRQAKGYHRIYFADTHPKNCVEFSTYPEHCVKGTVECDLVKELVYELNDPKSIHIPKNCTNGFLTVEFQNWLKTHPQVDNFIIAGLVTDICVMQFALTLKAYFDEINEEANLFIPVEAVETFHIDVTNHDAHLMNLFALYNMRMNGIHIVSMKKF